MDGRAGEESAGGVEEAVEWEVREMTVEGGTTGETKVDREDGAELDGRRRSSSSSSPSSSSSLSPSSLGKKREGGGSTEAACEEVVGGGREAA